MKSVSVIIPNWNGKELIKSCLLSLDKQTYKNFEIIVVDNGSVDGSVECIKKSFPGVRVIPLFRNLGFSKAINEGVRTSNSPYVAFLNNDTVVDKNWLKELVDCINKTPGVVSVGSKLINYYNRKTIDGVGIEVNEAGQAKSIGWNEKDIGQYNKRMYVFGVSAGAALFRRDKFIKIGMFDENYFMYSEEVDWAFRAQFLGLKSVYCPKAIVFHKHKQSSKKVPQKLEYWQFRNMTVTIIKDMPLSVIFRRWRWLKIILVHFNTILYQLKNGFYWPPVLADLWVIVNLPRLLYLRFKIQSSKKVDDKYIEKFLKKKKITFWGILR